MGEMLENIAHQWRQPLNSLGLIIQRIKLFQDKDILTKEDIESSASKSMLIINKMSSTIDDFRNFFKVNKHKDFFRIDDLIKNILILMEASLKNSYIQIDTTKVDKSIELYGYKNELEQVFINIINNAKDALIDTHTLTPNIKISSFILDNNIIVEIKDNAGGIDKNILNKIFDPYFTSKKEGKGTGIGLYMSKMIIEKNMNGKLQAKNIDGGACFTITLKSMKNNNY